MLGTYPVVATIPCSDLDRSRKFYTQVLGQDPESEMEGETLQFQCGSGTSLQVYRTRAGVGAGHTEAGFMVDDIEAVVASLRDAGVELDDYDLGDGLRTENGILSKGEDRAAWFRDPDGNVIGLFQSSGG